MGGALAEEARIVKILASIPASLCGPIEERHRRRCLSYKEVKGQVEWEVNRKTNADLFRDTYKGTVVPAKCTASQLYDIFEDFQLLGQAGEGGHHRGGHQ